MAIKVKGYNHYFGGKSSPGTYQTLINLIPPHKIYFSLFLGNCGVTRHMKLADLVFLNDKDEQLINAWKQSVPIGGTTGFNFTVGNGIEFLETIILGGYDQPETFIFLDPPYKLTSRKDKRPVYKFELTPEEHTRLLQACKRLQYAKIMIMHYPEEEYNFQLADWNKFEFYSQTRNGLALECAYYNYDLVPGELHDLTFIGEDFRQRERFNRIKKNFIRKLNQLEPELRNAILREIQAGASQ